MGIEVRVEEKKQRTEWTVHEVICCRIVDKKIKTPDGLTAYLELYAVAGVKVPASPAEIDELAKLFCFAAFALLTETEDAILLWKVLENLAIQKYEAVAARKAEQKSREPKKHEFEDLEKKESGEPSYPAGSDDTCL